MTDYAKLAALSGLNHTALADFHKVRLSTIHDWYYGDRDVPPGAMDELRNYVRWTTPRCEPLQ